MTNYEHYKSEIEKIVRLGRTVAIDKDGKPHACGTINCEDCIGSGKGKSCYVIISEWADAEYIEPEVDWSKVPVDTPILVKQLRHNNWSRRYFSHYENGRVYTFADGLTSWTSHDDWKDWNYAKLAEVDNGI